MTLSRQRISPHGHIKGNMFNVLSIVNPEKMHVVVASLFTFTRRLFDRSTRLGPSINYANWALNVKRCLLGVEVSARAPVENINIHPPLFDILICLWYNDFTCK